MKLWSRLRSIFRKDKPDAQMAEEMRLHLEMQTERNVAAGINAQRGDILRLVFSQAGKLVGIDYAMGLAGSLAATRLLRALFFQVGPQDPLTFVAVIIVLVSVTVAACWLPARRAVKIEPVVALRCE